MNRKKLFNRLASLVIFISLINFLAIKFHWYYSIWWFDMPMHFLGGMWVGLFHIWYLIHRELSAKEIGQVILGVFIVAFAWEAFEFILNAQTVKNAFDLRDTVSDLFFGLSGGFTAIFYVFLRIMNIPKSTLQFYNAEKN